MGLIEKIQNRTTLKTKIKVLNEIAFINLIVELGYREDKMWTDEENELLSKIIILAKKHTNNIIKEINNKKRCTRGNTELDWVLCQTEDSCYACKEFR